MEIKDINAEVEEIRSGSKENKINMNTENGRKLIIEELKEMRKKMKKYNERKMRIEKQDKEKTTCRNGKKKCKAIVKDLCKHKNKSVK